MTGTTTESSVSKPEMRPKIGGTDAVSSAPAASLNSGSSAGLGHAGWSSAQGGGDGNGYGPKHDFCADPGYPHDTRDQVLEATAIVRFQVALDGSAKVALITRTEYMTLDQLILDTLRNWRLQPAMIKERWNPMPKFAST
jgi:outer membrane biosynthesis protein TonB